jgi:hypothetical protein
MVLEELLTNMNTYLQRGKPIAKPLEAMRLRHENPPPPCTDAVIPSNQQGQCRLRTGSCGYLWNCAPNLSGWGDGFCAPNLMEDANAGTTSNSFPPFSLLWCPSLQDSIGRVNIHHGSTVFLNLQSL